MRSLGMTRNQRKRLKVQPSYGYQHSDCTMSPPAAVAGHVKEVLKFDLKLTNWYPKGQVGMQESCCGLLLNSPTLESNSGTLNSGPTQPSVIVL